MKATWRKYQLQFQQPAGTSRGVLRSKDAYFLNIKADGAWGLGEAGLLRGLSYDDRPDYEAQLDWLCENIEQSPEQLREALLPWPSILSAWEMALLDLKAQDHVLFPSDFTDGYERQPINGLIWMGPQADMRRQIRERIEKGFLVLKMKIGAIDLESEIALLAEIRQEYSAAELQLRVDANGAFSPSEAPAILDRLDRLRVHSIEQPITAGQWEAMAKLCQQSPLPIALDEELIGLVKPEERAALLDSVPAQYIIIKPSFLGGFAASEAWIEAAEKRGMGWWVTSALESNYGLSAIAQWNYTLYGHLASGLGTGSLYTNNFESPLYLQGGTIAYEPKADWKLDAVINEEA